MITRSKNRASLRFTVERRLIECWQKDRNPDETDLVEFQKTCIDNQKIAKSIDWSGSYNDGNRSSIHNNGSLTVRNLSLKELSVLLSYLRYDVCKSTKIYSDRPESFFWVRSALVHCLFFFRFDFLFFFLSTDKRRICEMLGATKNEKDRTVWIIRKYN